MKQVRREWANSAGSPGRMGLELNVTVSDTDRSKTQYQIRGVVDVPSAPQNDDERHFLANVLFYRTDIPQKESRGIQLVDWYTCNGGDGVRIHRCGPIPTLTQEDIIGDVRIFRSPEVEGLDEDPPFGIEEHNRWTLEYRENQYCRFESREELHQRLQDIFVNTTILTRSGRLRLTHEAKWYRLSQHIIDELLMRGQPLVEQNFDPRVERAQPFKDGELCRKAAELVSGAEMGRDVIVKYGKYSHMKELYEKGVVWMNPASVYDATSHNQAIRDNERVFVFKGGYSPKGQSDTFYSGDTVPEDIEALVRDRKAVFTRIFNAPRLERHEYAKVEVRSQTNYWLYCMAGALEQRLFSDFNADACVVIRKD